MGEWLGELMHRDARELRMCGHVLVQSNALGEGSVPTGNGGSQRRHGFDRKSVV